MCKLQPFCHRIMDSIQSRSSSTFSCGTLLPPTLCLAFSSVSFFGLTIVSSYLLRVMDFVLISRQHKYVSSKPKVHTHFINKTLKKKSLWSINFLIIFLL